MKILVLLLLAHGLSFGQAQTTQWNYKTLAEMKGHVVGLAGFSTAILYGSTSISDNDGGLFYFDQSITGLGNDYDTVKTTYYVTNSVPGAWIKFASYTRPGTIIMGFWAASPNGWLILNGGTIGDASSGGSELATSYAANLYYYFWNNLSNSEAAVSSGRGASAIADFDAHKTITIPDMRQRFPLGKSASGTGSTLGGSFGNIDHVHSADPPNTTSGAPSGTVAATALGGGAASTTHTHDINISAFNTASANPPGMAINFIVKY